MLRRGSPRPGNARRSQVASLLAGTSFLLLVLADPFRTAFSSPQPPSSRRNVLASTGVAVLAGLLPSVLLGSDPASAEPQAWQLKFPKSWVLYQRNDQPAPGDNKPTALIVAGDNAGAGELVVLRVPLVPSNGMDVETAKGQKTLLSYFGTPSDKTPTLKMSEAIDALYASQKTTPGLTQCALVGKPAESIRNGNRYIRYEYESTLCQGIIVKGAGGKDRCESDKDGEAGKEIPQLSRRHLITMTVVQEAEAKVPVLWFVDMSTPTKSFESLSPVLNDVSSSFEINSAETLSKAIDDYNAKVNVEAKDLAQKLAKEMELAEKK